MKNKKQFLVVNMVLVSTLLLSACNNDSKKNENEVKNKSDYVEKNKKYVKDNTTEVLIDSPNIKKEDIIKIIKHGDHWHVFTKDGKEHITYTDPNKISDNNFSLVSVVSLNQLRGLDIVSIKVHGDHWHVYTRDGREFLTYENPSSLYPNIPIGIYTGSHSNVSNLSVNYINNPIINEENKDEVVKILRHDDHWHIYTSDGKEYVAFSDPSSLYPNIPIGIYTGSHAPLNRGNSENANSHVNTLQNIDPNKKQGENDQINISSAEINTNKELELIDPPFHSSLASVIYDEELKNLDVNLVLKHDDHYHIYTVDKKEFISFNPIVFDIFKNAKHGLYKGSHGGVNVDPVDKDLPIIRDNTKQSNIKYAWLHGDHWHLHDANKKGVGIKYYINEEGLRELYPGIKILGFTLPSDAQAWENEGKYDGIKVDTDDEFYKKQQFLAKHYNVSKNRVIRNADKLTVEIDTDKGYITLPLSSLEIENGQVKIVKDLPKQKGEEVNTEKEEKKEEKKKENSKFVQKEFTEPPKEEGNTGKKVEKKEEKTEKEVVPKEKRPKINVEEREKKQKENLAKLSKILSLNEDDVIDKIFEIEELDGVPIAELIVNEDGTVSHNNKKYKLN